MTTPADPTNPTSPTQPTTPPSGGASPPLPATAFDENANIDPTGVWTRFLSAGGQQATPQDVRLFLNGLLKNFGVLIQQEQAAMKRASDEMKKAVDGN